MLSIFANTVIEQLDTLWCNGSTEGSDPSGLDSNSGRVVLPPNSFKKRDMNKESDNLESDPYKSQDFSADLTQRKIAHDLKSCVYGYCELSSERTKSFC